MSTFEWIIALLLGAVGLSALARRIKVPYPTFLAIGGALIAFVPSSPTWTLEPDLALALFVAPVLLDAAFDTSLRDLRNNWVPVSTLVVAAVGLTTVGVAYVAHRLMPDMPWAAAIALGAIVAPPDAAAAVAILSQVKLPHRMVKVLEGESLLNDATSLLIYRIAVGAVVMQHLKWSEVAPTIALALVGSVLAGLLAGRIIPLFLQRVKEAPSAIILQFATTFMVWIAAEHLGLSGILTIVVYAITMARTAGAHMPARLRVPSYAVWETMVFVLNVLAFMLIGMQMRPIWTRLDADVRWEYCVAAAWILLTVVLVRLLWVTFYRTTLRVLIAHGLYHPKDPKQVASPKGGHHHLLVRHARPGHACHRLRPAGELSLSRLHRVHRLCRRAGIARHPGPDAAAVDPGLRPHGRRSRRRRGRARPHRGLSRGPRCDRERSVGGGGDPEARISRHPDAGGRRSERRHRQWRIARRSAAPPRHRSCAQIHLRAARHRSDRRRRLSPPRGGARSRRIERGRMRLKSSTLRCRPGQAKFQTTRSVDWSGAPIRDP
ncbi:NhaP-type Na+/H+ or K+/H+ antiporter [Bradyrhizobium niftali]